MNNVDPILARLQQRSVYLSGCRICYGLTPMAPSYKNPLKERVSAELFSRIPRQSGVYFFYNRSGKLLYIGKAKNLRARLSSYRNAKPGAVPEKVIEMIERAHSIRWEVCASEKEALLREGELLHAVRPPFNTAGAWETQYLFIGTRIEKFRKSGISVLHFQLTSREFEEGYKLFGCFKHRPRTKEGYNALLRLIYAASQKKGTFPFSGANNAIESRLSLLAEDSRCLVPSTTPLSYRKKQPIPPPSNRENTGERHDSPLHVPIAPARLREST